MKTQTKKRRKQSGGNPMTPMTDWFMDTVKQITKKPRKTYKKMNCSPYGEKVTAGSYTCYSKDMLLKIKRAYNEQHPDKSPIETDDPKQITKELRKRLLPKCDKEDCWLNLLPKDQREVLDEMVFAPDHPKEWDDNPDEWLSNYDISSVLKQYEKTHDDFRFLGPTPIDFDTRLKNGKCVWEEICHFSLAKQKERGIKNIGFIFNLDEHDKSGSHWTSMFLSLPHKTIFYFDSALNDIPKEVQTLVDRIIGQGKELGIDLKFDHNVKQHQYQNSECGMYSIYFILTLLTEKCGGIGSPISFQQAIRKFKHKRIPDKAVFELRKRYFNPE